jgi:hypothetical protein
MTALGLGTAGAAFILLTQVGIKSGNNPILAWNGMIKNKRILIPASPAQPLAPSNFANFLEY